uniref:Large ribosomal subunit protein uL24c n=1 Tax=Cyanidium caldarium TaxID=2771 RepID=RK24_CYACA|nr:ribosomal protein L24 [Cyanidium caldarium]Q9TLU3.1 RecName: Full=Large ribosomal subunit protein uL24c; AltName: Full=50S ribosomal protein L24, chloroplastic [Cyanidium caldarium]AAF12918.1 unknown [Cyanidium caldarium]WDB00301.1 ribosomal protein L24 [Cyanidium caldarium]
MINVRVINKKRRIQKYKVSVKSGDTIKVISGKYKNIVAKVLRVLKYSNEIIVKGVNIKIKHIKPVRDNEMGSLKSLEFPINISKVVLLESRKKE